MPSTNPLPSTLLPTYAQFLQTGLQRLLPLEPSFTCPICHSATFSDPNTNQEEREEEQEQEEEEKIVSTPCAHNFHLTCLTSWLTSPGINHNTCPTCRRVLFVSDHRGRDRDRGESIESAARQIRETIEQLRALTASLSENRAGLDALAERLDALMRANEAGWRAGRRGVGQ